MPVATEDWANGTSGTERKRWTWTNWTQDDTSSAETLNPRVTESKVGDTTNTKRTTTDYYTVPLTNEAVYGLVKEVKIYDSDQTTVLKKAYTEYNLDNAYVSRRIIGLPVLSEVWGLNQQNNLFEKVSKAAYAYDEGDFSDANLAQNIANAIQHDNTNFSAGLTVGRGNPTSVVRHDVSGQTASVTSQTKYNTAGAPVAQIDPLGRMVRIGYADSFNDNQNRNTFAYPTKLTDPANNFSEVSYRYDMGANVFAKSPAPAGNSIGKQTARLYDALGRLEKETILNTGAYTRYEYPNNQIQSKVFSTIIDTNNNGADQADEVMSEAWTDGAGRTLRSRTEHPNSTGGWSGNLTEYDILGQVKRSSVPTEINADFEPTGDDEARGWLWTSAEYDWMGRTIRQINTDGTDKLYSFDGCGCAGGLVTTIKGEEIIETDWQGNNPVNLGRRTQKVYQDIQGRTWKSEVLNWDGTTPYTTTVSTFNGRDQVVLSTKYEAATGISQNTAMSYDGHGRIKTQHLPEQDLNKNTTISYFDDDQIQSVTDARGAKINNIYNNQGQLEQINYEAPQNSTIYVPQPISFVYDNAGNRIQMNDETGITQYQYNTNSQIVSETKQFPGVTNSFSIGYEYTLSGQLKSISNPGETSVNYIFDKTGKLTGVNGQGFQHRATTWQGGTPTTNIYNISEIVHSIQYRAWGGIKHAEFQDGRQYNVTYNNNKLSPFEYSMSGKIEKRYSYYGDGTISFAKDLLDNRNDRSYSYDHIGRITKAYGGYVARGESPNLNSSYWYDLFIPVKNDYQYNGFNNPNNRKELYSKMFRTDIQTESLDVDEVRNYTNNRVTSGPIYSNWEYDADGRFIEDIDSYGTIKNKIEHNAAGQPVKTTVVDSDVLNRQTTHYDGTGKTVKVTKYLWLQLYDSNGNPLPPLENTTYQYYLRSTVLGGAVIGSIYENGTIGQTNIFANGKQIAKYFPNDNYNNKFIWDHSDFHGISGYESSYDTKPFYPGFPNDDLTLPGKKEYDPHGQEMGKLPIMSELQGTGTNTGGNPPNESGGGWETFDCVWDGVNVPCGWLNHYQQHHGGGPVTQAPPETVASIWSNSQRRFVGLAVWNPTAAERGIAFLGRNSLGWLPTSVSYSPGSGISGDNVYQWFGGFSGNRLGSSEENPNFISETSVQLYSMLNNVISGANASMSANRQTLEGPTLASGIPKDLGALIAAIAKQSACKDALEKMFKALNAIGKVYTNKSGETDVSDLYNRIKEIKLDSSIESGAEAYEDNGRIIGIRPISSTMKNTEIINSYYAGLTIQELLHHSRYDGTFNDDQLDQAAVAILKMTKKQFKAYKKDPANRAKLNNVLSGTSYQKGKLGHSLVKQHCQYSQADVDNK